MQTSEHEKINYFIAVLIILCLLISLISNLGAIIYVLILKSVFNRSYANIILQYNISLLLSNLFTLIAYHHDLFWIITSTLFYNTLFYITNFFYASSNIWLCCFSKLLSNIINDKLNERIENINTSLKDKCLIWKKVISIYGVSFVQSLILLTFDLSGVTFNNFRFSNQNKNPSVYWFLFLIPINICLIASISWSLIAVFNISPFNRFIYHQPIQQQTDLQKSTESDESCIEPNLLSHFYIKKSQVLLFLTINIISLFSWIFFCASVLSIFSTVYQTIQLCYSFLRSLADLNIFILVFLFKQLYNKSKNAKLIESNGILTKIAGDCPQNLCESNLKLENDFKCLLHNQSYSIVKSKIDKSFTNSTSSLKVSNISQPYLSSTSSKDSLVINVSNNLTALTIPIDLFTLNFNNSAYLETNPSVYLEKPISSTFKPSLSKTQSNQSYNILNLQNLISSSNKEGINNTKLIQNIPLLDNSSNCSNNKITEKVVELNKLNFNILPKKNDISQQTENNFYIKDIAISPSNSIERQLFIDNVNSKSLKINSKVNIDHERNNIYYDDTALKYNSKCLIKNFETMCNCHKSNIPQSLNKEYNLVKKDKYIMENYQKNNKKLNALDSCNKKIIIKKHTRV